MKSFKAQISPTAYLLGHPLELKQICDVRDRNKKSVLSVISTLLGMFLLTHFTIKLAK